MDAPDDDIQLRSLEQELSDLRQELEHSGRLAMVGTVAAGVAHEVNNVLTPALAWARHLKDNTDASAGDDLSRKAADQVLAAIASASRILDSILELSRPTGSSADDRRAEVDGALRAAVDCLGRELSRDGVRLRTRIDPELAVRISPASLQQVFLNMLINARRALRGTQGGEVSVVAIEDPDGTTAITFADDGPGIASHELDRIFEPFVTLRIDTDRSVVGRPAAASSLAAGRRDGGTGLGLAICRRVIEVAGGSISARAAPGGGASFVIHLPTAPRVPGRRRAG